MIAPIETVRREGQANRATGYPFGAVLRAIREADEDEARAERLALEHEWEDYAESLTAAYQAGIDAAIEARNPEMVAALERMEAEGVRDAINAKICSLGGAKWEAL